MSEYIVELRNVEKIFQKTTLFSGVNLGVGAQESISICGDSGSGKTTLVNIFGLLEPPTDGDVYWMGENVTKERTARISRLRSKIFGYVFQHCNLFPELDVLENLLFPRRIAGKIEESDIEFAEILLAQVRLAGFENRRIATLSGGERQRVAVIRAMMNHPHVIVADEPTGNLDSQSAALVMDMIVDVCRAHGSSLLLITHNPKFAERMGTMYLLAETRLRKI
jgi:ABC-type lipoprotein export system ATPase subunit